MNWRWIAFVGWLTDERRLALLPARTIVRHPHHHESLTCREQGLNLRITWPVFWLSWMTLSSSDNHYMNFLHHCYGFFFLFIFGTDAGSGTPGISVLSDISSLGFNLRQHLFLQQCKFLLIDLEPGLQQILFFLYSTIINQGIHT